jgi:molybdate transport system regulatory protein
MFDVAYAAEAAQTKDRKRCNWTPGESGCGPLPTAAVGRAYGVVWPIIRLPSRLEGNAMKSSARNQFPGVVTSVRDGAINDEIELEIAAGQRLVSTVTRESRKALKLEVGAQAVALVKASSVMLVSDSAGMRFSARNQLTGKVDAVTTGAVNSEVLVRLPGGAIVVAIITNTSASGMALRQGDDVTAMFKASSVFLATQA